MNEYSLVNPLLEKYAEKYTTNECEVLQKVNRDTVTRHKHAHMLSGHVQGKFLEFISNIVQPAYVLEIGTFTGYSAVALAKGLKNSGQLHTIELREDDAATAQRNFDESGLKDRITLHCGDALKVIPTLPFAWDIVFIDADKTGYIDYYEMVLPNLSARGIMIVDNVLFHGQVLEEPIKGKSAKAVDAFNKHVAADDRVDQVMLTVRDGLLLIKKIQ